jgi:hypothetical protein
MANQFPITPAVAPEVLASIESVAANGSNVEADLTALQKLVRADKSAIVAGIVHVLILIVAAFKLKLSGRDVAVLGSIVSAGLSYFVGLNIRTRAKLTKLQTAKPPMPSRRGGLFALLGS